LEGDEIPSEALARELDEEIGLRDYGAATHVWHEEIRDPTVLPGWDGAINDYFLVPVEAAFEPCGSLGARSACRRVCRALRVVER
jgi:8-oxo-dGTP pyrophosphatase MutT (NUDIX family)